MTYVALALLTVCLIHGVLMLVLGVDARHALRILAVAFPVVLGPVLGWWILTHPDFKDALFPPPAQEEPK